MDAAGNIFCERKETVVVVSENGTRSIPKIERLFTKVSVIDTRKTFFVSSFSEVEEVETM